MINDTTRNRSISSSNYTIATQDISNSNDTGKVCGAGTLASNNNNMTNPTLADFIVERDTYPNSNVIETLANFTSVTMSGTMYYNNSYNSIQASVNGGYYYKDLMEN